MQQRASLLRKGSTFIFNNWAYTVIEVRPQDPKRPDVYRFQAKTPVETVEQFDLYDDMTRYVSTGDKK